MNRGSELAFGQLVHPPVRRHLDRRIKESFDIARSCVVGTLLANNRVAMVPVSGGVRVLMPDDANRREPKRTRGPADAGGGAEAHA